MGFFSNHGFCKGRNGSKSKGLSFRASLFLVKAVSHIPFRLLYAISDFLYYPVYYLLRYRRKVVRQNLTSSLPEKSAEEIVRIEKQFYHFLIDTILESTKLNSLSPEEMKRRMVFKGVDRINAMLAGGQSVSAYLGHFGNWEWISSTGLWLKGNAAQIYHRLRDGAMDDVMQVLRERMGNRCVDMTHTARFMARAKERGEAWIIGFIADQSPRRREAKHFIDFLSHRVPVLTGTEKATKHFGYAACYLSVRRLKRGYYECEFIPLHDDPASLPDFELTHLYFRRLEEDIRRHPELYLWSHNRFKYADTAREEEEGQ